MITVKLKMAALIIIFYFFVKIFAYDYSLEEIPFFQIGTLYTSEISSGIHFKFDFTTWLNRTMEPLKLSYNIIDEKQCTEKFMQNTITDCFETKDVGQIYYGTDLKKVTVTTHEECFQSCLDFPPCQFISVRPQEPWTANPITMECTLKKDFDYKKSGGSYVSALKNCEPRNDTVTECVKSFSYNVSNPIHRIFNRKIQALELVLQTLEHNVADMSNHVPPHLNYPEPELSFSETKATNPAVVEAVSSANHLRLLDQNRRKRGVDFKVRLDLNQVTKSIFRGFYNIFHFRTLKYVVKSQKQTIHAVNIISNRTSILESSMKKVAAITNKHEIDHKLLNLIDLMDLAISDTEDMIQALEQAYAGHLSQDLVNSDIAQEALIAIQDKLSDLGLTSIPRNSMDLFTKTQTEFFMAEGQFHFYTQIDTYDAGKQQKLFRLPDLPISINGSLYNLDLEKRYLAVEDGLSLSDKWYLSLSESDFRSLKKLDATNFVLKHPEPQRKYQYTCLSNLFNGRLNRCDIQKIEHNDNVYSDYLTENLIIFSPNTEPYGMECNGRFTEKNVSLGYAKLNPPHLCHLVMAGSKFQSRQIDFNINYHLKTLSHTGDVLTSELEEFKIEMEEKFNSSRATKEFLEENQDLNETMKNTFDSFMDDYRDDIEENQDTSNDNRIAVIIVSIILLIIVVAIISVQCKAKFGNSCCCTQPKP